ncbi:tubulin binding cofactor A [Tuber brumale]|nr:tubulin binding cofactor A [Tuber brumale]
MPPPTSLSIKTSSVIRLMKEEASYLEETMQQKAAVEKLEQDGADEYELRQPVRNFSKSSLFDRQVLEQTIVMAPAVRKQLYAALSALSEALEAAPDSESEENKKKARKALADGKEVLEGHGVLS